jgi:hypothetical protein
MHSSRECSYHKMLPCLNLKLPQGEAGDWTSVEHGSVHAHVSGMWGLPSSQPGPDLGLRHRWLTSSPSGSKYYRLDCHRLGGGWAGDQGKDLGVLPLTKDKPGCRHPSRPAIALCVTHASESLPRPKPSPSIAAFNEHMIDGTFDIEGALRILNSFSFRCDVDIL